MKKNVQLIIFFVALILGISFYYIFSISGKFEKIDINEILNNPNDYNNPTYLRTLSDGQKTQVIESFNNLLYDKCSDGKLNEKCTLYFLYSYLKIRTTLGELGYIPEDPEEEYENVMENIIKNVYLSLYGGYFNFPILSETDLNEAFFVPFLTEFCRIRIFNGTDIVYWVDEQGRDYWAQRIIGVNKTSWQSTDMQIFYLQSCMRVLNITQLSRTSRMSLEELNNKICNILPDLNDINTEDVCSVSDYLNMKRFCEVDITTEDRVLVEDLLSKKYESHYQKDCMGKLSKSYSLI